MKRYLMMSAFALAGLAAATGCPPDPTSVLNQDGGGGGSTDDLANPGQSILTVNTRTKLDLDVLFVVDNSPSMSPKQRQLATTIDSFIQKIDATGANYHIGVTTTNIGAQTAPSTAFQPGNLNIPGCDSYKGNDGDLQRLACTSRDQSKWSLAAKDACNLTLCKTKLEPLNGDTYLKKENGITNAPGNDIIGTFKCMAMLGDDGCGLESPLEAMKRALDGHSAVNSSFLRSNSVLAVVFITDEDDCSVAMASRDQNNPNSIDCTKNGMSTYNCWKNDFRCLAYNLTCDQPMTAAGAKTSCRENGNGYLEPVTKYVQFLSSLRPASKLLIGGIWSPTLLDNLSSDPTKDGKLIVDYDPAVCTPGPGVTCSTEALNRGQATKAACLNPTDSNFFGQAQLRLSSFIRKFDTASRVEQSICQPQNYGTVLDSIGNRLTIASSRFCLPAQPKLDAGNAVCTVGFVDETAPNSTPTAQLPRCGASCCNAWAKAGGITAPNAQPVPGDPTIVAACSAEPDCFCALPNPNTSAACKDFAGRDTAVAGIWVKAAPHQTPAGKVAKFVCENAP